MAADLILTRAILNSTWNEKRIDLDGLSLPKQKEITIMIPQDFTYSDDKNAEKKAMIASFKINENTFEGTPTALISNIFRTRSGICVGDELTKYISKNELWMISKRLIILDNVVAFIVLPTPSPTLIVGAKLMTSCSPIAKVLKEKVIPQIARNYNFPVIIRNTDKWVMKDQIFTSIDSVYDIILNHIDEICP